ncbi:MAG TPA: alcohol dehydrogenase catalytic domain-containing protein, partial [Pyrinomonadaceae bacterium]|nr:alcohol dehydrogenase catalytic domain-containing protein [Pyrinomonadaceae bacterium]
MRIKRILKGILKWISFAILLALFVGIIALFVAYWRSTNDCDRLTVAQGDKMKAIVYCDYGLANLKLADIAKPTPTDDQVLVKVHAASVNPLDWHFIEGTPKIMRALGVGLRKPKDPRLGVDFAGTVETVGKNV